MTIEGDYGLFAHLETVYLGCLARRSLIMRNVAEVVEAARGKQIFYFPARHDHWLVQTGDGWSAHVAGAIGVSTEAQASWWGGRGIGDGPARADRRIRRRHGRRRDTFAERYQTEMNITVLVDFENDSIRTALEVADALGRGSGASGSIPARTWSTSRWSPSWAASSRPGVNPRLVERSAPRSTRRATARQDRRQRRLHRRADPRVRGGRRPGRRLRRRLLPDPRRQRLHGRRGPARRTPLRQGRAQIFTQSASRSC